MGGIERYGDSKCLEIEYWIDPENSYWYQWRIINQNEKIFPRCNVYDNELMIRSMTCPEFRPYEQTGIGGLLYLRGDNRNLDTKLLEIREIDLPKLIEKIKLINIKYGGTIKNKYIWDVD